MEPFDFAGSLCLILSFVPGFAARRLGSFSAGSWSPPQCLTGELPTSIARRLALLSVDFPRAPWPRFARPLLWALGLREMAPFSGGFDERADTWGVASMGGRMVGRWLRSALGFFGAGFDGGLSRGNNVSFSTGCSIRHNRRGAAASMLTLIPNP